MRAMIVKELRENSTQVVLAFVVVLALMFSTVRTSASIVSDNFQLVTALAFAGWAVVLGGLQTLREQWRDRSAFILHRPASRTELFVAKVIAGLILYFLPTALPLAIVSCWAATPGHVMGPFEPHMLLPSLSDLMGGVSFYFASLLVCVRRARWLGSRLMPLGVPLVTSLVARIIVPEFWLAAVLHLIAAAVLIPAAWGSFMAGRDTQAQPRVTRAFQVLCVGFGFVVLAYVAGGIASEMWGSLFEQRPQVTATWQYLMRRDGRIMRVKFSSTQQVEVTDLFGKPLPAYPQGAPINSETIWANAMGLTGLEIVPEWELPWYRRRWPTFRHETRYLRPLQRHRESYWFYVVSRRTIEGFDPASRLYIGGLSPDGAVDAPAWPKPLPGPLLAVSSPPLLADTTAAYLLDSDGPGLTEIFRAPPGEQIVGAAASVPPGGVAEDAWYFIATRSHFHVLDRHHQPLFALSIPRDKFYSSIGVARMPGPTARALFWFQDRWASGGGLEGPRVMEIGEDGKVLSDVQLPPLPLPSGIGVPYYVFFIYSAVPFGVFAIAALISRMLADAGPLLAGGEMVMAFATMIIVGLVCAGAGVALARRNGLAPRRWISWAAGGLVFGIPGLFTLLSTNEWPARITCPSCGKRRVVTRQRCEHCGAPFAPPARDGTEIFDDEVGSAA